MALGLEAFLAGMFAVGLGIGVMLAVGALFIIQVFLLRSCAFYGFFSYAGLLFAVVDVSKFG